MFTKANITVKSNIAKQHDLLKESSCPKKGAVCQSKSSPPLNNYYRNIFEKRTLGNANNPGALMQVANQAQVGQQLQAMSQFCIQAMQTMGLGHLPSITQLAMIHNLGQQTADYAMSMAPQAFAQAVLGSASPQLQALAGQHVLNHGFDQASTENLGKQFLSNLAQQPATNWGRQVLGNIGPTYFHQFDPQTLRRIPNRALRPFSNQMMSMVQGMSPHQLGQQLLAGVTGPLQEQLGQALLEALPQTVRGDVGKALTTALQGDPQGAGESLLKSLGSKGLQALGEKYFGEIPGLEQLDGKALANTFIGALTKGGNVGENLLNAGKHYALNKLTDIGKQKLTDFGQNLFNKCGKPLLNKIGSKAMDWLGGSKLGKLGSGLLDKYGGKILDKLGGAGKIASGVLGLLNGKLDAAKALKIGLNFIPVVGPILGVVSMIPGIGGVVDKVLGGVGKALEKIPGVKTVLKGINKVGEVVGKGVKAVTDGVKNVGKAIGKGVENVGKAIGKGVENVGKAIGEGIKNVFKW